MNSEERADGNFRAMVGHVGDQTPQSIVIGARADGPATVVASSASMDLLDYRHAVLIMATILEEADRLTGELAGRFGVSPEKMLRDVHRQRGTDGE